MYSTNLSSLCSNLHRLSETLKRLASVRALCLSASLQLLNMPLQAQQLPAIDPASGDALYAQAFAVPEVERTFDETSGLTRVFRPDEQSVILAVRVGRTLFDGEFVFGYKRQRGDVVVGLGAISSVLSFPIQVDPYAGTAEGWFLAEDRTFRLSVGGEIVVSDGQVLPYAGGDIELHDDDIYVTVAQLAEWFPFEVQPDLLRQVLLIDPDEPLAFQQAQQRQAQGSLLASGSGPDRDETGAIKVPYQWAAVPAINITTSGSVSESGGETSTFGTFSVQSQGDLLGFSSSLNAFATYSDNRRFSLDTFDVLLQREDPSAKLLGPLKASTVALGDILMPAVPILATVRRGRGAYVSNIGSNRVSQADDFVLIGTVPPGWDVELYQDDRLVGFQTIGGDGQYEFSTLFLRLGANEFRIVAYGPNGEVDERIERVFLGPGLLSAGALAYEIGVVESSDTLLSVGGSQALDDEPAVVARFEYGVTDMFSVVAGGSFGTVGRRSGQVALFTGVRASLGNVYTSIDAAAEEQGSYSVATELQTRFGEIDVSAAHLQRFDPPADGAALKSETVIGFGHRPIKISRLGIGQRLEASREKSLGQPTTYGVDHRLSLNLLGWSASNSIGFNWFSGTGVPKVISGTFAVRGQAKGVLYRLQADYSPTQDKFLQTASFQARKRFGRDFTATMDIDREFVSKNTLFGLDLSIAFAKVSVGFEPSIDTRGNYAVGLNLRTTLLPKDQALSYRFAGAQERTGATILGVRVFVDTDGDGVYDDGEAPLPNIVVSGTRRRAEATTNFEGVAWVPNLLPGPQTFITVDQRTLPDVTYRPADSHVVVQTRPGVLPIIDFPVKVSGEVDGFVLEDITADLASEVGVARAEVLLLDESRQVVARTRTEFDGYYYFSELPLGDYRVQFNVPASRATQSGQIAEVSGKALQYRDISLTAEQPFVADINFEAP